MREHMAKWQHIEGKRQDRQKQKAQFQQPRVRRYGAQRREAVPPRVVTRIRVLHARERQQRMYADRQQNGARRQRVVCNAIVMKSRRWPQTCGV